MLRAEVRRLTTEMGENPLPCRYTIALRAALVVEVGTYRIQENKTESFSDLLVREKMVCCHSCKV